ncbi:aminotransferase [Novosphingobium umbonatum]|uniref:aspartate transaminase n=1 Tax=Novosphingobium umbonatum TaxID=1908524 RepID=A0A437N0U3_9SPHN|nr:aminotransferase [Novosphingobium umbonatum]RVU03509.1 aminotransferase [Novosphingobium umbonatum]
MTAPAPTTTIFETMSRLAQETGAINLGQGFPDMPEPPELLAAAAEALLQRSNQYPPMRGLPALRQALVGWYARHQGLPLSEEEVLVTSGATEALAAAILALVQPRDEVILVQPLYDAYLPLVRRAGGLVKLVHCRPPEWRLDPQDIADAISPRTRLLVLNTPNNPTGTCLDRSTLEAIGALCQQHDITLLCDEVWEATLVDGSEHLSALHIPSLRDRTVKVGSAGKIFSLTGWKVGWAIAAPALAQKIAAQHQFLTFTTATPLQHGVAQGLNLPEDWFVTHRQRYAQAKARLVRGLQQAGYVVLPNSGTWFVSVDLAASGLPVDDAQLAQDLVREAGVAAVPVSAFYADTPETGYLRLCFAKGDEVLDEAVARLARYRVNQRRA